MNKFIVNHSVEDFETTEITDERLKDSNAITILVLDDTTSNELSVYYNAVVDIILAGGKLYCVAVDKESKLRKTIMMAMANFRNYNIYRVTNKSLIDSEYIESIISREPDIEEVMQYVGGDIAAYAELNFVVFGISNLVSTGDLEGLKTFIEQHYDSIDSSHDVIEYLKNIADKVNSGSMQNMINNLKSKLEQSNSEINSLNSDVSQYRNENEKLNDKVSSLNKELQKANRQVTELTEQVDSKNSGNQSSIVTYNPLNIAIIKCRTQHIIYFKEISYVKYVNSLVVHIYEILRKLYSDKIKLMIYDNKVGIPGLYKGISILSSQEFVSNKDRIIRDTGKFVVSEPNQIFLESILTNISPTFEVVIVYDRMRQSKDLVVGPNVTRIFVTNSESNLMNAKESIRVSPDSIIISSDPKLTNAYNISEIPGFDKATESAKIARYNKMATREGSKDKLIMSICKAAKIDIMA